MPTPGTIFCAFWDKANNNSLAGAGNSPESSTGGLVANAATSAASINLTNTRRVGPAISGSL
jgi:hypothetical protein